MQYTIQLFERICHSLPVLVPDAVVEEVTRAMEQARHTVHLSPEGVEDMMMATMKKLWPFQRAFQEFLDVEKGKMGEQFFLGKLVPEIKQRYRKFKEYGGTFRDMYSGAGASFFAMEERGALSAALVDTMRDVGAHTRQKVLSTDREAYENRVVEFHTLFDDIEKRLNMLRRMAEDEGEHPELAGEIRSQIRGFEHGLCFLGPRIDYAAVCNALPYFEGRKKEKMMRRTS